MSEINGKNMKVGIRYVVTKESHDETFQIGEHVRLNNDGTISCFEEQAWVEAEHVSDAIVGMEVAVDIQHILAMVNKIDEHFNKANDAMRLLGEYMSTTDPLLPTCHAINLGLSKLQTNLANLATKQAGKK